MFYLTKKEKVSDIAVGDQCMVLADFTGIKAGQKGVITENYKQGVMVTWEPAGGWQSDSRNDQSDGFGEDELEYLAFATLRHPTKSK